MRCERRGETVTTVLLIRHALCDGVGRVLAGRAPGTRLNQEGRLQAECLAERLARFRPELPVLFTSGYTDGEIVRRGLLEPGAAFVQKPFTPDGIVRSVRERLDAASLR